MSTNPGDFGVTTTEILFQAFNWESCKHGGGWYKRLNQQANDIADTGITVIWFPPPSDSLSPQGYMPRDIDKLESKYGNENDLKEAVSAMKSKSMRCLVDTVLNHRCASHKNPGNGQWTQFGGKYNWDDSAIINNDPSFRGRGHGGTGVPLEIAPNIDHQQDFVKRDISDWLNTLQKQIGFEAYRIDYARGFHGRFVAYYIKETKPTFAVGEMWDGLEYDDSYMRPNQDSHRSRIAKWVDSTEKMCKAFDFTTKGLLMQACRAGEYWRLKDSQGRPAGFLGIWPERAVTFIDNHDTGSSQAHWPFPNDKVMQGYAYILTHPGIPTVFYDHVFDWKLKEPIKQLIQIRKEMGITAVCKVHIERADNVMYIARCSKEEKSSKQLYVKLGHGNWAPSAERGWKMRTSGNGYMVWTRDGIPEKEPEPTLKRIQSQMKPFLPVTLEQEMKLTAAAALRPTEEEDLPQKPVPVPAKKETKLDLDENKLVMKCVDAGPGKKKLVIEYEMDAEIADGTEFTITLCAQREDEVDSLVKRLS
eukprot:CAMPEP_0184707662 /NCGR_PEP_ID=MMETSP0313-20130426/37382_1 /TAXON_ID=2792 /ORGANISM="Porphyridium aerugineum, Strain SAG 1380-2" /LENGTH=531 /DNA_ID=CAMNT_0027169243 /DNA_START=202 /DNA_END=1797 /DNA_ORIENTATION=+